MSKRTKMRKHLEPRSIKPTLLWVAAMVVAVALTILSITVYTHTGSTTAAEGGQASPAMTTGPFFIIVILIVAILFTLAMLVMEIRQYIHKGKARRR